jgi:hypothetical protein
MFDNEYRVYLDIHREQRNGWCELKCVGLEKNGEPSDDNQYLFKTILYTCRSKKITKDIKDIYLVSGPFKEDIQKLISVPSNFTFYRF